MRCIHLIKREKRDCLIAGFLTSDPHGIDKLNTHNTKSRVQHLRILMRNDLTLHTGVALTHYAHTRTPRLLDYYVAGPRHSLRTLVLAVLSISAVHAQLPDAKFLSAYPACVLFAEIGY